MMEQIINTYGYVTPMAVGIGLLMLCIIVLIILTEKGIE